MGRLLRAGVAGNVFPGATACIGWRERGKPVFVAEAAGGLSRGGDPVSVDSLYDLASLTKPLVATAAMRMVARKELDLDVVAESVLTDVRGGVASGSSLRVLLSHRSGLAAWGGLYLDVPHDVGSPAARRWLFGEAARRVDGPPGKCLYSDLGFMLGGEVVARTAKAPLDQVVEELVTGPLGISADVFYASTATGSRRSRLSTAAPTEHCEWRGRVVRGEVHDENCAALGGVAGHAGVFGTAEAFAKFGRAVLDSHKERSDFVPAAVLHKALEDPGDGGHYRVGWDTKSAGESAAGRRASKNTFGHLGFTGTSVWCDPKRDTVVVLLSNRVHPSRANEKIRQFRPAFHDGLSAAFDAC